MEHPRVKDARSGRLIFLSHCCLNQNAKVRGIAIYPGAIRPLVEMLMDADVGMIQMPCPEMTYAGAMRWGHVKDQYNSPMFRRHCQALATSVLDQAEEYHRAGYQIAGFVMMDGSPVCGLNSTPQPLQPDILWGGMTWYVPDSRQVRDKGVFGEILHDEARKREALAGIPFAAYPESARAGADREALEAIRILL